MNYQGACDDEEAQPLFKCRGNLSRRQFYLVAAAGRDHGPDQKDRHRRRGDEPERPGSRRLGDRRNSRPADPLRQDGRHRRSRPLRRARSAESQIHGLGPRLWPGRFGQGRSRARQAAQSQSGAGGQCRGSRESLSGDLLVFDAENSRRRSVRRPQRHSGQGQADRLAQRHEEQRLHRLPSARQPRHAHAAEGTWRIQNLGRSLGAPRAIRPGRPADGQSHRRRSRLDADQIFCRVDRPHRRGRVAQEQAAAAARN